MKKFSWLAVLAMAMVLALGFVSCNNEPKEEKPNGVSGYALKTGPEINAIFHDEDKLNAKAATAFAKATAAPATPEFYLDIKETDVPVWYDEANTTIYYYIEPGKKLILNEDSSKMFRGTDIDTPALFTSIDTSDFDTSIVTSMHSMFCYCEYLEEIDVSKFDTRNVTILRSMFYNCKALKAIDLSNFNTSNTTSMRTMFYNCNALTSLDVSSFNTSNVTDMSYMFYSCSSLKSLDLSKFDTGIVTNMSYMFRDCRALVSLDVSKFNTSNVTTMIYMFSSCKSLVDLDVSRFNTSNVTDMSFMFFYSPSLESLDLSKFDTRIVTNMRNMFNSCYKLTTIYVAPSSDWASSETLATSTDMFDGCAKLKGGAGTVYDFEKIDKTYARVDGGTAAPGYFTVKSAN